MKKILYSLVAFAAAAVCFSSCGEVELSVPETPGYHAVHFTANSPEVKTVLAGDHANWVATDAALFHVYENGVAPEDIEVSFEGGIANVTALFPDAAKGTTEFVYSGFVGNANSNGNASVLAKQTPTDSSYDPDADILFAKPITTTDNNESLSLEFQFTRVVALNKMTLKGIKEGETISKITLTGDKSIIGSFNKETMAYSSNGKTLELTTSENEVYFVTGPVEDVTLTVTVATDKASYSKTFAKTIDFVAGSLYEFGVTFTDEHRSTSDVTYALVNNVSSLKAGDVIVLGNAANEAAAGAIGTGKFFTSVDATVTDGVLTSNAALAEITLGGSADAWTLHTSEGYVVKNSADIKVDQTATEPTTWTISISGGDATIAVAGSEGANRFLYNSGSPRFKTYTSATSASMLLPQIYKKGGSVDPVEKIHVSSVSLSESAVSVKAGATVTLVATVLPANADDKSVTWSSDDEDVATVSAAGVVTGVAEGTATITVTTTDGSKTASCEVTVTASSHVYGTFDFAEEGDFDTWTNSYVQHVYTAPEATVTFSAANKPNSGSAVEGIPVTRGSDIVLALTEDDKQIASVALTTKKWSDKTQTINVHTSTDGVNYVSTGETGNETDGASCTISKDGVKFVKFKFSSSSNQIGIAKLVFTTADYVEPAAVSVTGVSLNKTSATLAEGTTLQLTATVAPSDAANKNVAWSSNNAPVATVSDAGLVTAVAAGTATITVTTEDGSKTATCTITVTSSPKSIADIKALITSTSSKNSFEATLTDAIVTYVSGKNAFIEDATGGILYYASSNITNLAAGDKINGKVSGQGYIYDGLREATTFDISKATKTIGATVPVTELTASELTSNYDRYISCRVKLSNAAISTSAKTVAGITYYTYNSVTMYDGNADVIGYPGYHNAQQFTIWEAPVYAATPLTGISLNKTTASIAVGGTETLSVTYNPGNATNKNVTWSTSNSAVATVAGGVVTGVAVGTATITATSEDGGFTATCTVTVSEETVVNYSTTNTSNVTLSTVGGTSASLAKVIIDGSEYDALKAGTGKVKGALVVNVPAGKTKLHIHMLGWNGETVIVSATIGSNTVYSTPLISDSGVSSSSPFTLTSTGNSYYCISVPESTSITSVKITATTGNRFVIWGVNAE